MFLPSFRFFGGKGGVGKTTCAAAWAVESADSGPTLLVTTDPASSLADVLGRKVGSLPLRIPGARHLDAVNIDAAAAFRRWLEPRRELLAAVALRGTYLDAEDVARLLKLSLPGIDEVIGLIEIVELARGTGRTQYERVVVDTAPTGHTLRLLAAPSLVLRVAAVLDQLQAHHREIVGALRGSYVADAADAMIVGLDRQGEELQALLRTSATTVFHWVTLPEPMALEETADALGALAGAGIRVRHLVVNRLTAPPPAPCGWCDARRRFEARAVAPVRRRFPDLEIVAVPDAAVEPIGTAALRTLKASAGRWVAAELPAPPKTRMHTSVAALASVPLDEMIGGARWLLVAGKGGVGKTTCAAALAADAARSRRVLLVSTDPAHSLADAFGAPAHDVPGPVAGGPETLHLRELDAAARLARFRETYVGGVDAAFAGFARAGADQGAFRDLIDLAPPGIDEVIAIADVAEALGEGSGYDLIVTDTAPTGHALRLLQTPAVLREWTQALMSLLLKYREIVHAADLAALLVRTSKQLRGLQDLLLDRAQTRALVVGRAAALPRLESRRLTAALDALGIGIGAAIVNAEGAGTCTRCRGLRRRQLHERQMYVRSAKGRYAIIETPAQMPPPHGAAALIAWRDTWRRVSP